MVNFLGLGLLILFVPELTIKFGGCEGKAPVSEGSQAVSGVDTSDCPHGQGNLLFFFTYVSTIWTWELEHLAKKLHSGLNVLAFILSFLFIPGAQKVTLEEMNWICMSPTFILKLSILFTDPLTVSKRTSHNLAEHVSHPTWLHDRLAPKMVEEDFQLAEPSRYVDRFADSV